MAKRKANPDQTELPIDGPAANGGKSKTSPQERTEADAKATTPQDKTVQPPETKPTTKGSNGNGETHVLAENVASAPARPFLPGKIDFPLHRRVNRSFL